MLKVYFTILFLFLYYFAFKAFGNQHCLYMRMLFVCCQIGKQVNERIKRNEIKTTPVFKLPENLSKRK